MDIENTFELKRTIFAALKREDKELSNLHNKGIFLLQELAVNHLIGKAIVEKGKQIFNKEIDTWIFEEKIQSNLNRSDIVITFNDNYKVVIEVKTRFKLKKYFDDIDKLYQIRDKKIMKIFCGLMDFEVGKVNEENKKLKMFEERFPDRITRIVEDDKFFDYFTTKDHASKNADKQMCCVVGLWVVK